VGLTGLLTAKILGLKTVTIYHTDFPQYLRILTDDHFLESVCWKFMHWFYDSQDLIYVNSEHYRQSWTRRHILPEKLKILPRGLDTELFHPRNRNEQFFEPFGAREGALKLLYVGRISREKDLDVIVQAREQFPGLEGRDWQLVFVGHGPYVEGLKEQLPRAIFTGPLHGEELAAAYASGDVFLFPSTTDTFGNVVIEAHASGLPVVVSDLGGPRDLVVEGQTGFVTRALDCRAFAEGVNKLLENPALREEMGERGRRSIEHRNWDNAFRHFWALEEFEADDAREGAQQEENS
jgi:glycosyltransferase involved in cell wall biosynthesis